MAEKKALRSVAVIRGFDEQENQVIEKELPLGDYWNRSHDLIDNREFRITQSIRKVIGHLFSEKGKIVQHFENLYDKTGSYVSGWSRHEDGTIIEV